jgi:hypothetical protein
MTMTDMHDARRGAPTGVSPKITTWEGASRPVKTQQDGSTPPDPTGAVNTNSIVEFINGFFSIYDKPSGTLLTRVSDADFWGAASVSPGNLVDPRVVFIPDAGQGGHGQWLAVQLDMGHRVLMATTNPNDSRADPRIGNWKGSAFDLEGNDFTMLGYDANGVYIGTNVAYGEGRVPEIAVIARASALAWPPRVGPGQVRIIGPLKPEDYGTNLYPVIAAGGDGTVGLAIGVDTVTGRHLTYSQISNGTIVYHDKIEVPSFFPVPRGYRVQQPYDPDGTLSRIIFDATGAVAAPMGDGSNVWVAHTISSSAQYQPGTTHLGVRWYRLAIDPVFHRPSLAKWGEIGYPCYDFFNPSILSFGKDDYTILSLSRSGDSSTSIHPESRDCGNIGAYAVLVRETANDYWYEIFTLRSGLAKNYIPNIAQRWGDVSTIFKDPTSSRTAWIFNQYVTQGGVDGNGKSTSLYGDVIARVELPPP